MGRLIGEGGGVGDSCLAALGVSAFLGTLADLDFVAFLAAIVFSSVSRIFSHA